MNKRINVIISGVNFANKGSEAMLRTLQSELSARMPQIALHMWHVREPYWKNACCAGFTPILLPIYREQKCSWRERFWRMRIPWGLREIARSRDLAWMPSLFNKKKLFADACRNYLDRVTGGIVAWLDISGFAYGDTWGTATFHGVYPLWDYCQKKGRPMIFLPQAWGSFEKPEIQFEIRRMLAAPTATFYSRDGQSSRFLEKALGVPQGAIRNYPDIAFLFVGGSTEQGRVVLQKMGCLAKRPIIGIAPNMRVYERLTGKGMANSYLSTLVHLVCHCLKKHEIDVVLLASEIDSQASSRDDRFLCSQIAAFVNRPDRCFMTNESLSAELTKALVGRFEFLVGSRFHSFVFGLSQGIPGLAISWAHKYRELFFSFGLGEYVMECHEFEADELITKFEKAWAERRELGNVIRTKVNLVRGEVCTVFDEIMAKLNES